MTVTQTFNAKIVAIVDDDTAQSKATAWEMEDAGYQAFFLDNGPFHNVDELASLIIKNAQVAVCDHRLSNFGFANFYGAELVAALYDLKFPSLLITQYTEMDTSFSIRKWRNKIPVLLSRAEANASSIAEGIEACSSELRGRIPNSRKPRRTIVRITKVDRESGETVVDAFVPGWNPHIAVRFPASLVPENIQYKLKPNMRLFAHINIGAEKADDLYFEKFELAPEPSENDGLA